MVKEYLKPSLNELKHHGSHDQSSHGRRGGGSGSGSSSLPKTSGDAPKRKLTYDEKKVARYAKAAAKIEEKLKKDGVWFRKMKERSLAKYRADMRLTPDARNRIELSYLSMAFGPIMFVPVSDFRDQRNFYKEELSKIRSNRTS